MTRTFPARVTVMVTAVVVAACAALGGAVAQDAFPGKPITLWVGFPPGGGTDILARAIAEGAEKILGQKVVVVNKPGATGAVATAEIVKLKADGYTLLANTDTAITRTPHLRDVDYDPFRDLTYLNQVGRFKVAWSVRENSPFKTWREAVEWAKKNPGQLTFGHPGIGSTPHLVMAKLGLTEGIAAKIVPFAGDAPAISAILGNHVMMIGTSSVSITGHVQGKRLRVLMTNEKEGLDYAPDAVSLDKAGYDVEHSVTVVIVGPKGLPPAVADRLEKAFAAAMKVEPFVSVARRNELIVGDRLSGQALADHLRKVSRNYEALIKEAGVHKRDKK
jgi:tripartite-type tricarboxylate transporter receptor subunit TctC